MIYSCATSAKKVGADDLVEITSNITTTVKKCKDSPTWAAAKPYLDKWVEAVDSH